MTSKHSKGAGNITRMERINTQCMEARVTVDGSAYYTERSYEAHAWMCNGCGLVWEKRHQAAGCEARGHKASYTDTYYGHGHVENGVFKGRVTKYERRAIRREKIVQAPHKVNAVEIKTTARGLHRFLAHTGEMFETGCYLQSQVPITPEMVRDVVSFEETSPYAV